MAAGRAQHSDVATDSVRRADRQRTDSACGAARRPPGAAAPDADPAAASDDVRSLVTQLAARVDELTGERDAARRRVAELESSSDEDALLPVLNRRGFMRELARATSFVDRYDTPAALIVVHVDGLKGINDVYGRAAGDAVLKTAAMRLRRSLRASDVVGRLGGDAFGAILFAATGAAAADKARMLAATIAAEPVPFSGLRIALSLGGGAAAIGHTGTAEALIARARMRTPSGIPAGPATQRELLRR